MRKFILPAALAACTLPVPALAQDAPAAPLADLGEQMRDPAYQRDMALMLQAMTEVLLDMPIAPLAQAAAEMAGEKTRDIDPDLTLRRVVPQTDRVGDEVARTVPRAQAGSPCSAASSSSPSPSAASAMD